MSTFNTFSNSNSSINNSSSSSSSNILFQKNIKHRVLILGSSSLAIELVEGLLHSNEFKKEEDFNKINKINNNKKEINSNKEDKDKEISKNLLSKDENYYKYNNNNNKSNINNNNNNNNNTNTKQPINTNPSTPNTPNTTTPNPLLITVLSNDSSSLQTLQTIYPQIKTKIINIIKDKELLISFIKENTLVISLLPEELQYIIALYCLENNKNLLTTSYITEEIQLLNLEAKKKGLIFLFECGCNPGLDHIIASKVINEAKRKSAVITHYENWSGAIPSPECMDNPFLYKLTNSSLESLKYMISDSVQLINGKVKKIKENELYENIVSNKNFHRSYNFEGYYNRSYLRYKNFYNLNNDCKTIISGSIRYQGFTFIIQAFKYLNLFSNQLLNNKIKTWRDFLSIQIMNPRKEASLYNLQSANIPRSFRIEKFNPNLKSDTERFFYFRLTCYALDCFEKRFISKYRFDDLFNSLYSAFIFFGFYDEDNRITPGVTVLKAFFNLLENKISMKERERDLIYLKNLFIIKSFSGRLIEKTYELILYGSSISNLTATSFLVGRTCAVTALCLLSKTHKANLNGVCIPFDEIIADEVLKTLRNFDIKIIDKTNLITKF